MTVVSDHIHNTSHLFQQIEKLRTVQVLYIEVHVEAKIRTNKHCIQYTPTIAIIIKIVKQ